MRSWIVSSLVVGSVVWFASQAVVCGQREGDRAKRVAARVKPVLKKDLAAKGLSYGQPVFVRIFKEERELELWVRKGPRFVKFRTYPIAAMSGKLGPKLAEGDRQAPEGFYFVPRTMMHPKSLYHLAFNIGYPNSYDRAQGRTGSFIMVHGDQQSIGCFAMTDAKIEEIYTLCDAALQGGQPYFRVHSFPFRMTKKRMAQAKGERWDDFWMNLKEGYDWFEAKKVPPNVEVRGGKYLFESDK